MPCTCLSDANVSHSEFYSFKQQDIDCFRTECANNFFLPCQKHCNCLLRCLRSFFLNCLFFSHLLLFFCIFPSLAFCHGDRERGSLHGVQDGFLLSIQQHSKHISVTGEYQDFVWLHLLFMFRVYVFSLSVSSPTVFIPYSLFLLLTPFSSLSFFFHSFCLCHFL